MTGSIESAGSARPLGALHSAFIWACILFVTATFPLGMFLVFLASLPFDSTGAWAHRVGAEWGRTIVRLVPRWRVRVEGAVNLRDGPFVIVANHQSQVDILVTFFLPHHFKWISKRSVLSIPGLGWMMWMCRYIPLRRGDRRSIQQCLRTSESWIRRGVSVVFFPEGTRSKDGKLGSFKPGAFQVAAATGAPVLPVAILGTRDCLPANSLRFRRQGSFRIVVGSPIPSTGISTDQAATFASHVREKFAAFMESVEGGAKGAA